VRAKTAALHPVERGRHAPALEVSQDGFSHVELAVRLSHHDATDELGIVVWGSVLCNDNDSQLLAAGKALTKLFDVLLQDPKVDPILVQQLHLRTGCQA